MTIQSFFRSNTGFFDTSYHSRTYQGSTLLFKRGPLNRLFQQKPVIIGAGVIGLWIEKYTARYIRDHSLGQFAHSNSAVIRTACRTYNYLFPVGSTRKYFMEVALPDNFLSALQIEVFLHALPSPLDEPAGSDAEETILRIASVLFLVYCLDKVRQVAYKLLRSIPHHLTWAYAIALAPTGIYSIRLPNGEVFEFRN